MRRNQKGWRPSGQSELSAPVSLTRAWLRRLIAASAILVLGAVLGNTQETWEGNAAVVRRGTFALPGLYAASNSFPTNSRIEVRNLTSGKTVEVTVLQRIEETESIFLLLSEEAAKQLGMSGAEVIRVGARLLPGYGITNAKTGEEQAFNPDPDINPSAELALEPAVPAEEPEAVAAAAEPQVETPAEEGAGAPVPEAQPAEEPPPEEALPEEPEVETGAPALVEAEVEESPAEPPLEVEPETSAEQKRLAELRERLPQKQLFQPPRQSERFALSAPEEPEEPAPAEPELEVVEAPAEVEQETPAAEPEAEPPVDQPRASLITPRESEEILALRLPSPRPVDPERPEAEGTRLPAPSAEAPGAVTLEPPLLELPAEEPAAAEAAAEEEAVTPPETALARAPLEEVLARNAYFLQLGAYSSRSMAEKLARDLGPNYEVTILPADDPNRTIYKVLVGPLNTDESGTLLYLFKARGFKDAFLRYVE
jgi:hypothetical protein